MQTVFVRKNKSAVSPVIGTILMVAITVVLAAVLYVMVAGLGPGSTPTNPTIIMQSGSWTGGNTSASITSVTNAGNLAPTDLTYTIESSSGPFYSGVADLNDNRGGPTVKVHYNDLTNPGTTSTVSSGDSIRVQVTPANSTALSGASLKVFKGATQIGVVTLQ
jgi:archaeal type IV pilus assembly protein PilA